MRPSLWCAALAALMATQLGTSSVALAADKTWAVFDSKRAMEMTRHFAQAKKALEGQLNKSKTKLEKEKTKLEARRNELQAKKAVASSAALVEEEGKLVQDEQQLGQALMRSQRELALFEQKIKEQLFGRLEVAVQEVADAGGHTFVIDAGRVLYYVDGIDITKKVVKSYEKRFGDKPLDLEAVKLSQGQGGGGRPGPRRR